MSNDANTLRNALDKQIDALVEARTLSLDALAGIQTLRTSFATACAALEEKDRNIEIRSQRILDLETQLSAALRKADELTKQVNDQATLVKQGHEAITAAKVADAKAGAYLEAFSMVFRVPTVRETVHKSIPVPVHGGQAAGYVCQGQNESATSVTEQL